MSRKGKAIRTGNCLTLARGFRREGGARLPFDPAEVTSEDAPDWEPAAPPTLQNVAAMASTPMRGPGIHPGTVRLQPLSDAYLRWMRRNVTRQRQPGYCHLTVRLPLGDFTAGQMRVLADLADAYADGTMRLTIEQNVLFRWVKTDSLEPFYQRLAAAGLNSPDALSMSDVVSCPGAESCSLAVTQSRGLGRVLTEYFSARPELVDVVPSGNIRISGCPNGCGQHHVGSLGFQGSVRKVGGKAVPQYFVLVGGGVSNEGAHFGKVVAKIPAVGVDGVFLLPGYADMPGALRDAHGLDPADFRVASSVSDLPVDANQVGTSAKPETYVVHGAGERAIPVSTKRTCPSVMR